MEPGDLLRYREYQAKVLSPCFATHSLLTALEELDMIRQSNQQLVESVETLRTRITELAASIESNERTKRTSDGAAPAPFTWDSVPRDAARPKVVRPSFQSATRRMSTKTDIHQPIHVPAPSANAPTEADPSGEAPVAEPGKGRRNSIQPVIPQALVSGEPPREEVPERLPTVSPSLSQSHMSMSRLPPLELPHQALDAVFAGMCQEARGNVAKMGLVTITGNSVDSSRDADIVELINPEWNKCWMSKNQPNSWVLFDFNGRLLSITHYSIRTYSCTKGYSHLRSWVLEGCASNGKWFDLDAKEDSHELNGRNRSAVFHCTAVVHVAQIRLRQTGPNHHKDHYLILSNIEFFGSFL
jgi:hypothetical protein